MLPFAAVFLLRFKTLREGEPVLRSPHPPQAVPLPLRGEGINAAEIGARLTMSGSVATLRSPAFAQESESPDCQRNHLIHRKRSPFPYEGKDLTPLKLGRDLQCRVGRQRGNASLAAGWGAPRPPGNVTPTFIRVNTFPYEGKGNRLRWMRSAIATNARHSQSRQNIKRAIVLPLEGKGDRSAVDEVNCSFAPLREASKNAPDKETNLSFIGRYLLTIDY